MLTSQNMHKNKERKQRLRNKQEEMDLTFLMNEIYIASGEKTSDKTSSKTSDKIWKKIIDVWNRKP